MTCIGNVYKATVLIKNNERGRKSRLQVQLGGAWGGCYAKRAGGFPSFN